MTAPAGCAGKLLIEASIELRWRDLDALNHVNNAAFLTFFEEARVRWFETLPGSWAGTGASPVLVAVHVNYRRQLTWPRDVRVRLLCQRIGHSSLTIGHELAASNEPGQLFADGHSVLVWIDSSNGKPVPLPESVIAACS